MNARAGEVARLTAELAELDSRTDDLQAALAAQRETAEAALVDLRAAQDAAAAAGERAEAAQIETRAATVAIDEARARLDEIVATTYMQGIDTGPLGLLTDATSPEDLLARAEFTDLVARSQLQAQESLERARVDKANADSAARAALEDGEGRRGRRGGGQGGGRRRPRRRPGRRARPRRAAGGLWRPGGPTCSGCSTPHRRPTRACGRSASASTTGSAGWPPSGRRGSVPSGMRPRAGWPRRAGRPAVRGSAAVQRVIDRAMSQIGVQYVWGGGNGRGPSTGIPDAFGSPLNRVGFDCSGLMLYAFDAVGVDLPRVSRNQFHAGGRCRSPTPAPVTCSSTRTRAPRSTTSRCTWATGR